MPRKIDYDEARKLYASHGCELIETQYVNSVTPMEFRCKCGTTHKKAYSAFARHPFCDRCGKTCKLGQDDVAAFFAKHGCRLLDQYTKNNIPLNFECKCGKVSSKAFCNFKRYPQCKDCSGKHSYSIEEVRLIFAKSGCELLDTTYKNGRSKLKYVCNCGNHSSISLEKFIAGQRCQKCALRIGHKNGRWNPDRELVKLNQMIAIRSLGYLKRLLRMQGKKKENRMQEYVGYSTKDLRERITGHHNWGKVKCGVWHIDHIFPIKAFLENGITDPKLINSLDNLQPLSGKANLKKGAKYNKKEFQEWLRTKIGKSQKG